MVLSLCVHPKKKYLLMSTFHCAITNLNFSNPSVVSGADRIRILQIFTVGILLAKAAENVNKKIIIPIISLHSVALCDIRTQGLTGRPGARNL